MDDILISPEKYKPHPFLSRGFSSPPQPNQKNDDLYVHRCGKFDSFDWLEDLPAVPGQPPLSLIEVRFKNSRKDFFRTIPELDLHIGDIVAVEASPGHDIGIVSLTGELVRFQLRKKNIDPARGEFRKIYRRARSNDIEKWIQAVETEEKTLYRSREIAERLGLQMKINDVEYQGDNTKAIFYYTADDRVDFRELIKVMAEEFKVRIEMKQIGARQEASRLGGIGSCGRELCCSTWLSDFRSVTTHCARIQQLSLNPQKLAGQCSKLKCCLNYEYEVYMDAIKDFPDSEIPLKTKKGDASFVKSDIFEKLMCYSYTNDPGNAFPIPVDQVSAIQESNKKGILPAQLEDFARKTEPEGGEIEDLGQDDLTRFDSM